MRDLEGVTYLIDNILIYGNTQEEHDKQLLAVLNRLEKAGVTSQQRQVQIFTERSEILRTHPFPGRSTLRLRQSSCSCEHGRTCDHERIKMLSGNGKSSE